MKTISPYYILKERSDRNKIKNLRSIKPPKYYANAAKEKGLAYYDYENWMYNFNDHENYQDYSLGPFLGSGKFSEVYKGKNVKTGQ